MEIITSFDVSSEGMKSVYDVSKARVIITYDENYEESMDTKMSIYREIPAKRVKTGKSLDGHFSS